MKYRLLIILFLITNYSIYSQNKFDQNQARYSIHIGASISQYFMVNSVNNPLSSPVGPAVSLSISKDKFILLVSAQFGNSMVNDQPIMIDTTFINRDTKLDFRSNCIGFGYQLISYKNLLIHPYIGASWSYFKVNEQDKNMEAWGIGAGLSAHLILNKKNGTGNYVYLFQNTRFDLIELTKLNKDLGNWATFAELGICFRFCANTK